MGELLLSSPFTLADAAAAGFDRDDVRALVRGGDARNICHGVYISSDVPDSPKLKAAALKRVVPERAVICRRTAAWLHDVDVLAFGAHLQVPPVEILVPAETAAVRRRGVLGYSGVLRDDEVHEVEGVLVTSPVRTALDLGRWLPLLDGVAGLDAMLHAGIVDHDELHDAAQRLRGYRHKLRLDKALDLADGRAESPQESRLRIRLVVYAKLPEPEVQFVVPFAGGEFRLDLAYVELRVAVEYDGEEYHSQPEDVAYDEWRRMRLHELGWTVHVARSDDVLGGWLAFADQVRASLAKAARRMAA